MSEYGYCPICTAPGVSRERGIFGNDRCANGHEYKSSHALTPKERIVAIHSELGATAKKALDGGEQQT